MAVGKLAVGLVGWNSQSTPQHVHLLLFVYSKVNTFYSPLDLSTRKNVHPSYPEPAQHGVASRPRRRKTTEHSGSSPRSPNRDWSSSPMGSISATSASAHVGPTRVGLSSMVDQTSENQPSSPASSLKLLLLSDSRSGRLVKNPYSSSVASFTGTLSAAVVDDVEVEVEVVVAIGAALVAAAAAAEVVVGL